jgi:HlyD family secretion protein
VAVLLALSAVGCGAGGGPNPSGTLEATEVDISPLVGGEALSVRVELGDTFSKGDTLIVIDTEVMRLQRAQAATKARSVAAQMDEARQALSQAESRLELAEATLERTTKLVSQGSATQQQLDELTAQRDVAASQVKAGRARLNVLAAQRAEVAAALAVLDRQIRDGYVLAPQNGTVLVKALEPGEVAMAGRLALRVADLTSLELRVFLGERDLDRLRIGRKLPVLVDALDGKEISGTVTWISSESEFTPKNAQTRNAREQLVYAAKLRVENPDGRLHIGMPAEVRLPRR